MDSLDMFLATTDLRYSKGNAGGGWWWYGGNTDAACTWSLSLSLSINQTKYSRFIWGIGRATLSLEPDQLGVVFVFDSDPLM